MLEDTRACPRTLLRAEGERRANSLCDLARLGPRDTHADIAYDLRQRARLRHDRDAPREHRLRDREAEALVSRRLHVDGGPAVPRRKLLVGDAAGQLDVAPAEL